MRLIFTCLVLLSIFACSGRQEASKPLWGDAPVAGLDLRAALAESEVPLLESIELVLDLFTATEVQVQFEPSIPEGFVGTIPEPVVSQIDGGTWSHYRLKLQPVVVGSLTIPPFSAESQIEAGTEDPEYKASTSEFELLVIGVLEGAGAEVEAPADAFETPFNVTLLAYGIAGLVLLLILFILWRRRVPKLVHPTETPLPAHVKALRELSRLKAMPRIMPAEIDAFYVAVSDVLRSYLEDRFGLHAPDRTTEEFLPEVEKSAVLDRDQQAHLGQFLQQTDLVKFAKMVPDASAHDASLAFAEELVESTREDRVGAPAPAPSLQEVAS